MCCRCRVCLEGLTLRTVQSGGDRSVVSFGPACNYIRLERCEIGGFCGLILPKTKEVTAREVSAHVTCVSLTCVRDTALYGYQTFQAGQARGRL